MQDFRIDGECERDKFYVLFDRLEVLVGPVDVVSMWAIALISNPVCFDSTHVQL